MTGSEIITRRRKWTPAQKAALLAEVEAEGGKVVVVARRHGISESLLYNWRSAWKAAGSAMSAAEPVDFVPLGVVGRGRGETADAAAAGDRPIATAAGQRRRGGNDRDRVAERCPCLRRWPGEREGAVRVLRAMRSTL